MGRRAQGWRLRKRPNGVYSIRFTLGGERREISTGEGDSRRAAQVAPELFEQAVLEHRRPRPTKLTASSVALDELCAEWLAEVETYLSKPTAKQYAIYVSARFVPFFKRLSNITTERGREYVQARLGKVKRKTVTKELSALRGLLTWCHEHGHLSEVPHIDPPPRRALGTTRFKHQVVQLESEMVEAILAELPVKTGKACKPRAFYTVMWETGLRTGTLQRLKVPDHYQRDSAVLRIRDEIDKARFGREVPLTERAREALDEVCPGEGLIFGRHEHRAALRAAAKRAGLPQHEVDQLTNHDFRHARASHLARRSANLPGVAHLLGHKHITTTSIYAKPSVRAAEEVLAALLPPTEEPAHAEGDSAGRAELVELETNNGADFGAEPLGALADALLALSQTHEITLVRKAGVEPARELPHRNLNVQPRARRIGIPALACVESRPEASPRVEFWPPEWRPRLGSRDTRHAPRAT